MKKIILLLVLIFAFPYWAKAKIPFPGDYLLDAFVPWQYYFAHPVKNNAMPDVVTQMYPFKHLLINLWRQGIIPLWNPYNFSGNPLLGNYQSAVFHPLNWLFFLLPEIDAWSIMILLQPLLAGLFTYLYGRQIKLSSLSSLLSAIAFMFCGFITVWGPYGTMGWAILWLPLVLYALEKTLTRPTRFSGPLISLSLVASFFSGHFQISLYVLLTALAYLGCRFISLRKRKNLLKALIFIILGICLAMPQIIPTLELYQYSVRGVTQGVNEIIPWSYWPTMIAPDFFGNPVTRNDWFGHYAEWSSFVGVIPLFLALFILFKRKNNLSWFFWSVIGVCLLVSHPSSLLDLMVKLKFPVISNSAVARINCIISFSLAILAGFGFEELKKDLEKRNYKKLLIVSGCFLLVFMIIWGWLIFKSPFNAERLFVAKRNLILPTAMAGLTGLLVAGVLMIKRFRANWVLIILIAATAFDLFRFAHKWTPFSSREYAYPELPITNYLDQLIGPKGKDQPNRLFGYFGMEVQNYFQIPGFNGYDPLYSQRYGELLMAANNEEGKIQKPSTRGVSLERRAKYTLKMANLMGGKYLLHALEDGRSDWTFDFWNYPKVFKSVYEDDKYQVYENLNAYPRAFMVYQYQLEKEPQKIIDLMLASDLDLRQGIVLEEKPQDPQEIKLPKNPPQTEFVSYTPNKIELSVNTETPGLLFLSDNYYPGWKVLIDGQNSKIYRADYTFRAIQVPAGQHQIAFLYQPKSFKLGLTMGLISILMIFLIK